jgi:hypothetical protein
MTSDTGTFLAALGDGLMALSGMTADDLPDVIAAALVGGGGADAFGVGTNAGLTSAQTKAVLHALAGNSPTGESSLVRVWGGGTNVAFLLPGARWYSDQILQSPQLAAAPDIIRDSRE